MSCQPVGHHEQRRARKGDETHPGTEGESKTPPVYAVRVFGLMQDEIKGMGSEKALTSGVWGAERYGRIPRVVAEQTEHC